MRRYAGALIGLGVLAVVAIVVIILQSGNSTNNPTPTVVAATTAAAENELQIISLPSGVFVNQLEIKTVTGTNLIKLENAAWKQTTPTELVLDSAVVTGTVSQIAVLRATDLIPADKAGNLAAFGLDKPILTATLGLSAGTPQVLVVGSKNVATNSHYVKLASGTNVWAINSFVVETLQNLQSKPPTPAPSPTPIPATPTVPAVTGTPGTPGSASPATTTSASLTPSVTGTPSPASTNSVTTVANATTVAPGTTVASTTVAPATTATTP